MSDSKRHPMALDMDEWRDSRERERYVRDAATGHCLANRVDAAFRAGWQACERRVRAAMGDRREEAIDA